MSAAVTHPEALTIDVDAPLPVPSTVSAAPGRLRLDEARARLAAAGDALDGWYIRRTETKHTYVADGHEAIGLVDAVMRELCRVRAALINEIRIDEDERAVRVDDMIAKFRTRQTGDLPSRPIGVPRRNGGVA